MKKIILLFLSVTAWSYSFATLTQITTGTLSANIFCGGDTVNVPYTVNAAAKSGNVFTAQLSDDNGNFTTPVNIGSLASKNSGTIVAVIPVKSASGTKYKIRVVSSNPVVIGSSTANFSITPKPTNLVTSNITSSSVQLTWNAISIADNYAVRYSITGGSWSKNITVHTTSYTFTGLLANTNYTLEVREKCGGSVNSKWSSITVTTQAAVCNTPTGFFIDTISCTYATFKWNAVAGASSYVVKIRDVFSGGPYKSYFTSATQLHVGALIPAEEYAAKIASICGPGDTSAYTAEQEWEQNYGCRLADQGISANEFKIYPNPSSGNFKIQYQGHNGESAEIIIRNSVGQIVYHGNETASEGLNEQLVSLKEKGLYIVQVKLAEKTFETSVDID